VSIIYTIVKRQDIREVVNIITCFNPKAFYTIEDVRAISEATACPGKYSFKQAVRSRSQP
jgi:hypothetical protein